MSDGICAKHVKRGQSVTLCATHTTIPSTIPQGKHVLSVFEYDWLSDTEGQKHVLYSCYKGSCRERSPYARNVSYTDVSISCLTIKNVQNDKMYILDIHHNGIGAVTSATFYVTCGGMCDHVYINIIISYVC